MHEQQSIESIDHFRGEVRYVVLIGIALVAVLAVLLLMWWTPKQGDDTATLTTEVDPFASSGDVVRMPENTRTGIANMDSLPEKTLASTTPQIPARPVTLSKEIIEKWASKAVGVYEGGEFVLVDNEEYTITFLALEDYVQVQLKSIPYMDAHAHVESYLEKELNVTPTQLCALNIDVFMPSVYDSSRTQDLGFSACPGPREAKRTY